ncbi:MAG: FtsW/RodA/SpoVE family cell cycle protein [Saccharofermentans sp.]|nr:FtsW/RodA/SpoVE family cell cycle protein [Saccharofermentans sp.]
MTEISKRSLRVKRSNIPLILMMFVIVVFGLVILYSVSGPAGYAREAEEKSSLFYLSKQLGYTVAGLVLALVISFIPIKLFKHPFVWGVSYGLSLLLIVITKVGGYELNGAKRWIKIGGTTFQTSEFVKVAIVIALAGYRAFIVDQRKKGKLKAETKTKQILKDAFFDFILPVSMALLIDAFILIQPHFSCFLIVGFVVFMCTLNSGVSLRSWLVGGLVVLVVGIIGVATYITVNPDYQGNFAHVVQRFNIFATTKGDETTDVTDDEMRQVTNAHNALGSGGMWGRGLGNSRAKYNYVSEAQNDYIFSIYVEETGFVGGAILILVYLTIFAMFVMVILKTDSIFSRMIATGCSSLIMIQVLLNLAVELQIAPSTGVTLPFVSYGGTAQVFLLIAYGMILSVSRSGTAIVEKKELDE